MKKMKGYEYIHKALYYNNLPDLSQNFSVAINTEKCIPVSE